MILHGNNLDLIKQLPDNSVHAVVTDPPYGLGKEPNVVDVMRSWVETGYHEIKGKGFMGKEWDAFVPQPLFWREVYRVLKPGGHMLVACGTRTQDWMAMSLRFAGFEIRDNINYLYSKSNRFETLLETLNDSQKSILLSALDNEGVIGWCFGSGFPKSHNISKSLDGILGKQGSGFVVAGNDGRKAAFRQDLKNRMDYGYTYNPSTESAKIWKGFGTALKPAIEFFTLCRKPLEGTITQNVLKHGTGGLNIDACRVEGKWNGSIRTNSPEKKQVYGEYSKITTTEHPSGRWPANVVTDGSDDVLNEFPESVSKPHTHSHKKETKIYGNGKGLGLRDDMSLYNDAGTAARFFYTAKASKTERGENNTHPTVKPLSLMRWLVRLITREGDTILDPFGGSGTTAEACVLEGRNFVIMEREVEYVEIIKKRLARVTKDRQGKLF